MAKKDLHDERLEKGLAALRSAGIAARIAIDAPTSASVAQLKSAIGQSAEADIAAIFMLGKIAAHESLHLIREIEITATDKDVKKEIKRALFKLSQKGIVEAQEPPAEKKPAPLFERESEIEAYMSAVDGGGGRLVWIAKPQPNRGLQVIQAMLHDRDGLLRFGGVQMKRKELRAMADEIKQQHGVSMIAVPWEFADWIIYEGYERAKARGQSGQNDLNDFHAIRSVIGTGKPKAVTHPVYQKLGAEDFRDGSWREQSRRLLAEPELRYWVIVDEWVQDCLAALHEAQSSPLVLNPVQKEERLASVVRDAVKTLCAGDNGQAFKRRMEDMALYFAETGRLEQAKVSLAVAQQVGEGDPGPLDISFLTGLMQKSFVFLMSQMKAQHEAQQKAEQSSLIIKP
ncbi:MAG: hypothetical protein ACXWWP_02315 [Candidatus Binatia bacterium]